MPSATTKPMSRRLFAIERASLGGLGSPDACISAVADHQRDAGAGSHVGGGAGVEVAVCVSRDGAARGGEGKTGSDSSDSRTFAVA